MAATKKPLSDRLRNTGFNLGIIARVIKEIPDLPTSCGGGDDQLPDDWEKFSTEFGKNSAQNLRKIQHNTKNKSSKSN